MITEEQLQKWGQAPSPTEMKRIQKTRETIEEAIKKHFPAAEIQKTHGLGEKAPQVYLQGSYANSTNIRFDSDVDIVAQINDPFWSDKSQLTDAEKTEYTKCFSPSSYKFKQYKQDMFEALQKEFGKAVEYKNKCIFIKGYGDRVDADVVPCLQYRLYQMFISADHSHFIEGIKFLDTSDDTSITNFPKIHLENCKAKNVDTDGQFKAMARVFKNIKRQLVKQKELEDKIAPSYFIENLLYNCSSTCFDGDFTRCMTYTLQFLYNAVEKSRLGGFVCANDQDSLFGETTWNQADAIEFILKVGKYFLNKDQQ